MNRLIAAAVASLAFAAACHNRGAQFAGGCSDIPLAGPAGHVELVRAETRESASPANVRIIAVVRWVADPRLSQLPGPSAIVWVGSGANRREVGRSSQDGITVVTLPDSSGTYRLRFGGLGARALEADIATRQAYVDTVRVFLQHGGFTLCA